MEIFNPKEWALIHKTTIDKANHEVKNTRKKANLCISRFDRQVPQKQFDKPITLSSQKFNSLLGAGLFPGTMYLLYGEYATGKTQICLHACVSLYNMYKDLKTSISTLFIDSEDTFRPERIQEIATEQYKLADTQVFSRIRVVKASSTEGIYTVLKKIDSRGLDDEIKLIIIDSLTKYVRVDLGNDEISNIQVRDKLKSILVYLREITEKYNIVTIINSQVTGFTAENMVFANRPIMEYVLNHYIDEVIYLHKEGDERWAHLVNSQKLCNKNIPFTISSSGIIDYEGI